MDRLPHSSITVRRTINVGEYENVSIEISVHHIPVTASMEAIAEWCSGSVMASDILREEMETRVQHVKGLAIESRKPKEFSLDDMDEEGGAAPHTADGLPEAVATFPVPEEEDENPFPPRSEAPEDAPRTAGMIAQAHQLGIVLGVAEDPFIPDESELPPTHVEIFGIRMENPNYGDDPMTDAQLVGVNTALSSAGFGGKLRHTAASQLLGREIASIKDLDKREAHLVMEWFSRATAYQIAGLGETIIERRAA